jgi:hypothetical protein
MAVPANTLISLNAVGNREDLSNEISRIAPEQTPFSSNIGSGTCDNTYFEWQQEDLDSIDTDNSHLEGDDTTIEASNVRDRVGSYVQIFKKSFSVSGTQEEMNTAGLESEIDRQKMLKLIAMKRDVENIFLSGQASRVQSGSTTRRTAGALAWITSNDSRGTGGADGGFASGIVAAPTNGTQRAFAETQLKDVMRQRFNNSGDVGKSYQVYMSATHKDEFAAFAGLSDTRDQVQKAKGRRVIYGAADVYQSSFGTLNAIPVAYGLTRDVLIADPSTWKKVTYRKTFSEPLAKNGDSFPYQIIGECGLKCLNEKANAVIADLS